MIFSPIAAVFSVFYMPGAVVIQVASLAKCSEPVVAYLPITFVVVKVRNGQHDLRAVGLDRVVWDIAELTAMSCAIKDARSALIPVWRVF